MNGKTVMVIGGAAVIAYLLLRKPITAKAYPGGNSVGQGVYGSGMAYPFALPAERTLFMRGHLSHSGMVDSEQDIYADRIASAGRVVNPQYLPEIWSLV
jgi:hypothetical protein